MKQRVILLVIDSLGVGCMEDVERDRPQDRGANTFYHILDQAETIAIPNLEWLGVNRIVNHPRLATPPEVRAAYGRMKLAHFGADSYAGHQEIMGTRPQKPFIAPFKSVIHRVRTALEAGGYQVELPDPARPYLVVNGGVVVADNIETDYGQIYNVTAPLDRIPFEEVLRIGRLVRANVAVNRVIALGGAQVAPERILASIEERSDGLIGVNCPKSGVYQVGYQCRHLGHGVDPARQVASILTAAGFPVTLIGKMQDVIECVGAHKVPAVPTGLVMETMLQEMGRVDEGLIAATVQETDLAGHAQNVGRYAAKIMEVDRALGDILARMTETDLLLLTADHGNDPTIGHSQHTREQTLLLAYGKNLSGMALGLRETLSDIAATIAEYFGVAPPENGTGFYRAMEKWSVSQPRRECC
jgi:phosphopentomutase